MSEQLQKTGEKIWKVGTLTYTLGGIIALSFWMIWGDFVWAMKDRAIGPSSTLLFKQIDDDESEKELRINDLFEQQS